VSWLIPNMLANRAQNDPMNQPNVRIFAKFGVKISILREELQKTPVLLSAVMRRYTLRIRSYTAFMPRLSVFMPYLPDKFLVVQLPPT
jgi:hypothetical protein